MCVCVCVCVCASARGGRLWGGVCFLPLVCERVFSVFSDRFLAFFHTFVFGRRVGVFYLLVFCALLIPNHSGRLFSVFLRSVFFTDFRFYFRAACEKKQKKQKRSAPFFLTKPLCYYTTHGGMLTNSTADPAGGAQALAIVYWRRLHIGLPKHPQKNNTPETLRNHSKLVPT